MPALCLLLCFLTAPADSSQLKPLSYEQAQALMHAVGQVTLREQLTLSLLTDCSGEFGHLAESASLARTNWLSSNTSIVEKSRRIRSLVEKSIQSRQSDFDAVKFSLDIEAMVHNGVKNFQSELASKNRKDRHYLCNRLILSISAGEWDLEKQYPDEVSTISNFKE